MPIQECQPEWQQMNEAPLALDCQQRHFSPDSVLRVCLARNWCYFCDALLLILELAMPDALVLGLDRYPPQNCFVCVGLAVLLAAQARVLVPIGGVIVTADTATRAFVVDVGDGVGLVVGLQVGRHVADVVCERCIQRGFWSSSRN